MKRLGFVCIALGALAAFAPACSDDDSNPDDILVPREDVPLSFSNPDDCAECHEQHVEEWQISNHAYAIADPVFDAMLQLGQKQTEGKLGQFCVQCHTPPGLASGQTAVVEDEESGDYVQDLDKLDPISRHGVSCDVCHSITDVIEPFNARAVLTPDGVRRATIQDPVDTPAHGSEYSELHETSDLCSMCHAVVNPKGALVEETFGEWENSSFAEEGTTCQDCHMPEYKGKAAPDGPERTLHRHFFVGVDVSLLPEDEFPGYQEMRDLTEALLVDSAKLSASYDQPGNRLDLTIENLAGHALPSGATAERQMWVDLAVEQVATGDIVFESGMLDGGNDLYTGLDGKSEEPGRDPQLVYFGQVLVDIPGLLDMDDAAKAARRAQADDECIPVGLGAVDPASDLVPVDFPWQATWQCNYLIPADGSATPSYNLGALPSGNYQAIVALKFRTFPPYFLRELEEAAGLDPAVKGRLPTVTMQEIVVDFSVP